VGLGVRVGSIVAHPLAKVEKRMLFGQSESITLFYEAFKAQTGV